MPDAVVRWFKLEARFPLAFAVGGLLPLAVAVAVNGWFQWILISFAALNFVLLIDALRSGVWLRTDGLDVRPPLAGYPRRVGWRSIEAAWWRPSAVHPTRFIEFELEDGAIMRLPRVRGLEELAVAIQAQLGPIADGRPADL